MATLILLALAIPALDMRLGFPDAGNDPPSTMTRQAYDLNTEGFGPGTNGPLVIAADLPDASGKAKVDELAQKLGKEPEVAFVAPVRMNEEGNAALLTVIPKGSPQDASVEDLVHRLREDLVPRPSATPASRPRSAASPRRSRTRATSSSAACLCSSPASSGFRSCSCSSRSTHR